MSLRAAILVVVVAATAPSAYADEPVPAKARALAETGRQAHDHGDYPRAIAAFKEAYVMAPAPALLFNLAQAYRLQGNCEDAQMMYRRFLGSNPNDDARALATAHLATVERCLRKRALDIPMDESMAYLRVPAPPGDLGIVDAPVTTSAPPGQLQRRLGAGLAIGGTAALAIAAYYGVEAHRAAKDVEAGYVMGMLPGGPKGKELAERDAEGRRAATRARIAGIGGGLAVISGVTLYVLGKRAERAAPLAIVPTAKGAQVSVAWRF